MIPNDGPLHCPSCGSEKFRISLLSIYNDTPGQVFVINGKAYISMEHQGIEAIECADCHFFMYHSMAEKKWKDVHTKKAVAPKVERSADYLDILKKLQANPDLVKKLGG